MSPAGDNDNEMRPIAGSMLCDSRMVNKNLER